MRVKLGKGEKIMYKFLYTERTNEKATEFETKSLLYLFSMREDSKEIDTFIIDCFNDVTGINKDCDKLWDVQSKGVKSLNPTKIGESLITLFENYMSEIKFDFYILFFPKLKDIYFIDNDLPVFRIDNFKDNYIQKIIEGLGNEFIKRNYLNLDSNVRLNINQFLKEVNFVIADTSKSKYVKNIMSLKKEFEKDDEFFNNIFNEIRDKQSVLKNISIHNKEIKNIKEVLGFNKHLNKKDIEMLIINRIVGMDIFKNKGIPIEFYPIIKGKDKDVVSNIIYSNENNKGKTLVIQSILYAIGNDSIFPSGFDSNNYYFFVEILINNKVYKFLRKKNTIVILGENLYRVCDSITEFKHFINDNIFKLPFILKDDKSNIVNPMLYYQIFFIGQDKRNSSNIFNNGQYNKKDFWNMLCTLNGYPLFDIDEDEKEINKEIENYRIEIKKLKKTINFFKDNPKVASFVNQGIDKENFEKVKEELNEIIINISSFKKTRKSAYIRKTNLENLIGELNSINHHVEKGTVQCLNCGSKNISYTNGDISFDISNTMVRKEIINSINQQIISEQELIEETEKNLEFWQNKLEKEISKKHSSLNEILLYSDEILSSKECDEKISILMKQIKNLQIKKEELKLKNKQSIEENNKMKNEILNIMNKKIKKLDSQSRIKFTDLFTKNGENYSGSEEQEFYFCKIIALNEYFKHEFPIIIDSFRDGEISSAKEIIMLDEYKMLNKQVILSSTLKNEEYNQLKYNEIDKVNAIDYSKHESNKILQKIYVGKFNKILDLFEVI